MFRSSTNPGPARRPGAPSTLPVALLGLSLLSVGALAVQAAFAERARGRDAEATLAGYSDIVALQVAGASYTILSQELQLPFTELERASADLRGLDVLREHAAEAERCSGLGESRWFARMPVANTPTDREASIASAEWDGEPPASDRERRRILEAVFARMDALEQPWSVFPVELGVSDPGSVAAPLVVASSKWRPGPEGSSIYLMTSCLGLAGRSIFEVAVNEKLLLPEAVFGTAPRSELFRVAVTDAAGSVVWSSHPDDPDAFDPDAVRRSTLEAPAELLATRVEPTRLARASLAPAGLGAGRRLGLVGGLFLLNAILLAAAVFQLRRERELLRLRESFVSSVSHELRTPLQQMLIFGDLLRLDRLESDGERERAVSVVSRETRRLIHMVENVLAFRDGTAPSVPVHAERPYPLDDLVADVIDEFRILAESRRVELELQAGCGTDVSWHPDAVRRVLLNLLDNAAKYGPAGGRVTVATACTDGALMLAVADEGPGIPPEDRKRVLEPYRRGTSADVQTHGGSGIGLAIVHELVRAAGGGLVLAHAVPTGLRVEIRIPVRPGDAP